MLPMMIHRAVLPLGLHIAYLSVIYFNMVKDLEPRQDAGNLMHACDQLDEKGVLQVSTAAAML